jgi:probable HAF family extracellular repeat protein
LGGLPGSTGSGASAINDVGVVVGYSDFGDVAYATEWSGGSIINLNPPGSSFSAATAINDAGVVVGYSTVFDATPEPSTWAMMLLGFAGLSFAGYRRARAGHATLAA